MKNGLQKIRRLAIVGCLCGAVLCIMMLLTAGLGYLTPASQPPAVTTLASASVIGFCPRISLSAPAVS